MIARSILLAALILLKLVCFSHFLRNSALDALPLHVLQCFFDDFCLGGRLLLLSTFAFLLVLLQLVPSHVCKQLLCLFDDFPAHNQALFLLLDFFLEGWSRLNDSFNRSPLGAHFPQLVELDVLVPPCEGFLHQLSVNVVLFLLFPGPSADADGDGRKPLVDVLHQITRDFLSASRRNSLQSCGFVVESFEESWLVRHYHPSDGSLDGV